MPAVFVNVETGSEDVTKRSEAMSKRTESHDAVRKCMRMMLGRLAALAAAVCVLMCTAGAAGGERAVNEVAKLTDPDGEEQDWFGVCVAVDGDVAVVGAPHAGIPGMNYPGRVLIYRSDGSDWVLEASLGPSDPALSKDFGCAVAIDGGTIVVGDWYHDGPGYAAGAAYVFSFDGSEWTEEAKLLASDAESHDYFGKAVAVAGDVAIIGAPLDDDLGNRSGSVYVFRRARDVWEETAKLHASNAQDNYQFGGTVAMSGDWLIAGGLQYYGGYGTAGYVFRFDGGSWIEEAILLPEEVEPDDGYGVWVDIDGNVAVVGAREGDGAVEDTGAVYVFRNDGASWIEETKLFASDGAGGERFGYGVAVERDVTVAGAPRADDNGASSGSAYVFVYNGAQWVAHSKLLPSDGAPDDQFGGSVAIDSDVVIIGAPCDQDHGQNTGSAYVFSASEFEDCNNNGVPDYLDIANGTSEDCNENLVPDECDIADGTSEDCNENGIPDECDIADLTSWDCNHNGIPDECDIASGYSEDVNGDGIPDECWFPGDVGVVPLMQKRTLYVHAWCYDTYQCDEENSDEALDFAPYDNTLQVECWEGEGTASQQSTVEQKEIRTAGLAHAHGCGGGGCWCAGEAETTYEFAFGAPYAETALLKGQMDSEGGEYSDTLFEMSVAMRDSDGVVLFEEESISQWEPVHIDFCQSIEVQEQVAYTLSVEFFARAGEGGGSSEFTIQLTALGDVDGDWDVDTADLLALLAAWGPNEDHPADFNGDGTVNTTDLLALLGNWGP
jgi:hypothetical protein